MTRRRIAAGSAGVVVWLCALAAAAGEANLAPSARVSVSGHHDAKNCPASRLHDGVLNVTDKSQCWVSGPQKPAWVLLEWDQPQTIGAVRIVSGLKSGNILRSPIQDFVLRVPDGLGWKEVPGAAVKGNTDADVRITFQPIRTRRLNLLITKTHDGKARLFEVELYAALPALPIVGASTKPPPAVTKRTAPKESLDQRVATAIAKAQAYLLKQQLADGRWWPKGDRLLRGNSVGSTAVVAYALLESGVSFQDPKMAKALAWLGTHHEFRTYTLGFRASAYLAAERQAPGRFRKKLQRDVTALVRGTRDGSYEYEFGKKLGSSSNDHIGVLGVWAGAQGNVEVPRAYWTAVQRHWARMQQPDGGWTYRFGSSKRTSTIPPSAESNASMTAGGVATLMVCNDMLNAAKFTRCTGQSISPRIQKGLDWLAKHLGAVLAGKHAQLSHSYSLYAIERAALASGYKYFGQTDWYRAGAERILEFQKSDGSFAGVGRDGFLIDPMFSTCFSLLFLIRGRQAVVMNKLEFDGDWNNRPRDLAMVTRWMSRKFERTVHWQIIHLKSPVHEWHDAPILYISASRAPKFTDADIAKLRTYVHQGGTILTVTECGGAFRTAIRAVHKKLFPNRTAVKCPTDHAVYSAHFKPNVRVPFEIISNGVRPLVIHTDRDLAVAWQTNRIVTQKWAFQTAANLAMYVSGSIASLRPRGAGHWPEPGAIAGKAVLKIARVKHTGNYDPEPLALERLRILLARRTGVVVDLAPPVAVAELPTSGVKVACLTGTGALKLSADETAAIKRYVDGGGTLVVDAAGGDRTFASSAQKICRGLYGGLQFRQVVSSAPLYRINGYEISQVHYRAAVRKRLGATKAPRLRGVAKDRRFALVFSQEDLTAGLVGYASASIDGYTPASAFALMRNILLHAAGN